MPLKKILLVEDDLDDRLFFQDFLNNRHDLVLLPSVTNGEELLEYLEENKSALPDAIILDQNMPRLNGLQTLQQLKNSKEYRSIAVMVYSTYVDEYLDKKSREMGAAMVFSKPQDNAGYNLMMDEFFEVMRRVSVNEGGCCC